MLYLQKEVLVENVYSTMNYLLKITGEQYVVVGVRVVMEKLGVDWYEQHVVEYDHPKLFF